MIDQWIIAVQENPDRVLYACGALVLVAVGLFLWRRSDQVRTALDEVSALSKRADEQETIARTLAEELRGAHMELGGLRALAPQREAQAVELTQAREALTKWQAEDARLREELRQQRITAETREALLAKTGDDLRAEFKLLAGQVLDTHGEKFEKANAARLTQTLAPLKEHIGKFEVELRGVHEAAGKDRAALKSEIEMLTKRSLEVSEEAHNLTQAL